jgi:hypothetical protein
LAVEAANERIANICGADGTKTDEPAQSPPAEEKKPDLDMGAFATGMGLWDAFAKSMRIIDEPAQTRPAPETANKCPDRYVNHNAGAAARQEVAL